MYGTLAPALTAAATLREPSAFMTTTDQSPDCTSQVSECWPFAAQKRCSAGGPGGCAPSSCVYAALNGAKSMSETSLCAERFR